MKPSNILKTIDNENDIAKLLLLGNDAKENDIKAIAAHLEDGEYVIQDSRYLDSRGNFTSADGRVPFSPYDGVRALLDYIPRTALEFPALDVPKAIQITSTEVAVKPQNEKSPYVRLIRLED